MEHQAGQFRAVVEDGVLRVLQCSERHLTTVHVDAAGTEVRQIPYSSISSRLAASPVLAATWSGDGYADVDLDCGAQRWHGVRSLRWIRTGLYRAGFVKEQVDSLLRKMKGGGIQTCPKHH